MKHRISLIEVKNGTSAYSLIFKGYIPRLNSNKLYYFDYIGTEIKDTNAALIDFAKENLTIAIYEDFGGGPFDLEKVKQTFGTGKEYFIELWENN